MYISTEDPADDLYLLEYTVNLSYKGLISEGLWVIKAKVSQHIS